jgi:hypothetical protein
MGNEKMIRPEWIPSAYKDDEKSIPVKTENKSILNTMYGKKKKTRLSKSKTRNIK